MMKNKIGWLLLAFMFLASLAMAADAIVVAPTGNSAADGLLQWLTPIIVPLVLAGFKKVTPSAPSWLIPLLAPVIGIAIDYVNHFATGHTTNVLLATVLGAAGVGLREVKDQLVSAPNGGWSTPNA